MTSERLGMTNGTKLEYQLSPYRSEHREGILKLLGNEPHKRLLWDWQFAASNTVDNSLVVAICDNEVIGFNGAMPVTLSSGGEAIDAVWSCDFHVDGRVRGTGVGKQIKKELHQRSAHLMSLGISDQAEIVLGKSGWQSIANVRVLRRYNGPLIDRRGVLQLWQLGSAFRHRISRHDSQCFSASVGWTLPDVEVLGKLWTLMSRAEETMVARTPSYLRWRYQLHPTAHYQYMLVHFEGEPIALAIFTCKTESSTFVDYVGPLSDLTLKQFVLGAWLAHSSRSRYQTLTTGDGEFHALALSMGMRNTGLQRFMVKSDSLASQPWFVMAGDSDGEFLQHAKREVSVIDNGCFYIARVGHERFMAMQEEWDGLLDDSDADPLFMGWAWQSAWWDTWGRKFNLELFLFEVRRADGTLVALLPLSRRCAGSKSSGMSSIAFIGTIYGASTVRTELCDIVVRNEFDRILNHILSFINSRHWDEWFIRDIKKSHRLHSALEPWRKANGFSWWRVASDPIYSIDLTKGYESYKDKISASTRLKMFNRRNRLNKGGVVTLNRYVEDIGAFFSSLNQFHEPRWGKACFDQSAMLFHLSFINRLPPNAFQASELKLSGCVISVLYDVRIGRRIYNIQQGYDQNYSTGLSLGTLHMGYVLELYFSEGLAHSYELLAGNGKKTNYKSSISEETGELYTGTVVRNRAHVVSLLIARVVGWIKRKVQNRLWW